MQAKIIVNINKRQTAPMEKIKSRESKRMQHSSSAKSITLLRGVNTFVHRVVEIKILRDLRMAATAQS